MANASRIQDFRRLEEGLRVRECLKLLEKLQDEEPLLKAFEDWSAVLRFMHRGTSSDPRKNRVLHRISVTLNEDRDPGWYEVLLAIFWPGLESIHWKKRAWDADPEELWQNIAFSFLQSLHRLDPRQREHRLVQRLYNDTIHHLHIKYRRTWTRGSRETVTEPNRVAELARGVEEQGFNAIELRDFQESVIARLREYTETGHLKPRDFALIVGTRIYGETVADYARRNGLNYEMAKKRRQRAEATIRRLEEF